MPCYSQEFYQAILGLSLSFSLGTLKSLCRLQSYPTRYECYQTKPPSFCHWYKNVTLKSFYSPLSSHSDPANPAKQEHVYPAVILFFVVSVHVPPFWQGFVKQGPTTLAEISKNKDLERKFRKTWNSIKDNKNICMISMLWIFHI